MNWEQIAGVVRHILTFVGGWAVAKGYLDTETLTALVGAIVTVGGVIWSFMRKTPKSIVTQAASIVPVTATAQREVGITEPVVTPATPGKGV